MTILAKNFIVFAVSSVAFLLLGFGIMFGDGNALFGTHGLFFATGADNSPATGDAYKGVYSALNWTGVPLWAKFFFQLVFAGTAATIVSGAVAERIKFGAFYLFSFAMVGLIYPVVGHWIWGGGWLAKLGMWDFAGSTVVHSVGGWAALVGAIMLGPRLGQVQQGRTHPPDPRTQHRARDDRGVRPVVRLVRIQPGQHDGRRPGRHRAYRGDHQHGGSGGAPSPPRSWPGCFSASPISP